MFVAYVQFVSLRNMERREMKTLIFDSHAGHLQWISNREIYLEALEEFDDAVSNCPHRRGLRPADWTFYRVSDEKAKEVVDWWERGGSGEEFPIH
jgi:hypothetical protein